MKRRWLLLCTLGACIAQAQQVNLKTGAWEVTMSGGPLRQPQTDKECVTKADLAQFSTGPDKDEDADCKYDKAPTIAGKTWSAEKSCPGGRKVRAEFTAETPERIKGSIMIAPGSGQKASTLQISGKWLASSCKGVG
jgi:hypothetical protein